MSGNNSIGERITQSLELPRLAMNGCAHIELAGNREAVIDGCMGILEYDDSTIALNLGGVGAKICGSDLCIRSFELRRAVICGCFASIEFC